jgi:hypothetical protein
MAPKKDVTELYRLMVAKLFNKITAEELARLHLLLQQPWARKEWDTLQKKFKEPSTIDAAAKMVKEDATKRVKDAVRKHTGDRNLLTLVATAITMGLLALASWQYFHKPPASTAIAPQPVIKGPLLRAADGKTTPLVAGTTVFADTNIIVTDPIAHTLRIVRGTLGNRTLEIPVGMGYIVSLPDGTQVFLNAVTRLSAPVFSATKREVSISGEAYFKVAKDVSRPFIVHVPQAEAIMEVLGTSFNVNTYNPAAIKISLEEGAVRLLRAQHSTELTPGFQAVYYTDNKAPTVQTFTLAELSWLKGEYSFKSAQMEELVPVLKRWFDLDVVIEEPLHADPFTATLHRDKPLGDFLKILENIGNVKTYYKGRVLHIR